MKILSNKEDMVCLKKMKKISKMEHHSKDIIENQKIDLIDYLTGILNLQFEVLILSIVLRKFSFILNRLDYLIPGWAFPVKDAPAHVCP